MIISKINKTNTIAAEEPYPFIISLLFFFHDYFMDFSKKCEYYHPKKGSYLIPFLTIFKK